MELFAKVVPAHRFTGRSPIKYDGRPCFGPLARSRPIHARRRFIAAVAVSVASIVLPFPSVASEEPTARPVQRGADPAVGLYRQHCVNCHGKDGTGWRTWLVTDQRFVDGRPDVLTFVSEPLSAPMKLSGEPVVHLIASH